MENVLINAMTYNLLNIQDMMEVKGIIEIDRNGVYMTVDSFLKLFDNYKTSFTKTPGIYKLSKKVASLEYYCMAEEAEL